MGTYFDSLRDYDVVDAATTGTTMKEEAVSIEKGIPTQTTVANSSDSFQEGILPRYLEAKAIRVKRYVLKK